MFYDQNPQRRSRPIDGMIMIGVYENIEFCPGLGDITESPSDSHLRRSCLSTGWAAHERFTNDCIGETATAIVQVCFKGQGAWILCAQCSTKYRIILVKEGSACAMARTVLIPKKNNLSARSNWGSLQISLSQTRLEITLTKLKTWTDGCGNWTSVSRGRNTRSFN